MSLLTATTVETKMVEEHTMKDQFRSHSLKNISFDRLKKSCSFFRSKKKSSYKFSHLKRTKENINLLLTKGCGVTVHDDGRGNITESFADFRVKKEKYQSQNSMLDLL